MEVKYIDHMGSDLTVVNAARVSFAKESEWEWIGPADFQYSELQNRDKKLINYLARHGHWTPFGHPQITLHVKVPIFVARQLHKHQVGFVVNEVSRRYVDEEPEFYEPALRERASNKKQGSLDEEISVGGVIAYEYPHDEVTLLGLSKIIYNLLIKEGVAPEVARAYLPLCTYTEFYMTGSLAAWSRLYNLRIQTDAQKEIQEVAKQIGQIIEPLFPVSWKALWEKNYESNT